MLHDFKRGVISKWFLEIDLDLEDEVRMYAPIAYDKVHVNYVSLITLKMQASLLSKSG